ncbi:MAG: peptidoglycan binding domain-containing protein, partial [bacterium]
MIITLPTLAVLFIAAFFGYCSMSGVDVAWALGTSGWAAPPGSRLAGTDIGGKSLDQISSLVENLPNDFNSLSVWLAENPDAFQIQNNKYIVSTSPDEFALSVVPGEFGLNIDITAMRREIALLDEKTKDPWAIGSRLKLWDEPPTIPIKLKIDREKSSEFLTSIKSVYDREPVDARLDLANRTITSALDGLDIDIDSTLENIPEVIEKIGDFPVKI